MLPMNGPGFMLPTKSMLDDYRYTGSTMHNSWRYPSSGRLVQDDPKIIPPALPTLNFDKSDEDTRFWVR